MKKMGEVLIPQRFKRIFNRTRIPGVILPEPKTSWTHCLSHQLALDGKKDDLVHQHFKITFFF